MRTLLKWIGIGLGTIVTLVVVLALAITLLIDPNDYRDDISALAAKQGVELQLKGDLGWQFFPKLGISLNDLVVADPQAPNAPIARLAHAAASVQVMPLLQGQIHINGVTVDGAQINLTVDADGKGNWESLTQSTASEPAPPPESAPTSSQPLKLDMETLSLSNSALVYDDRQAKQRLELSALTLTASAVNLTNTPFPLVLSFAFKSAEPKLAMEATLKTQIAATGKFDQLTLSKGELDAQLLGQNPAALGLDFNVQAQNQGAWQYQGKLALRPLDLKQLLRALGETAPQTGNPQALQALSVKTAFKGSESSLTFDDFTLQLDQTRMTGTLAVTDFASSAIRATLAGDAINLDDYLPPPAPEAASPSTAQTTTAAAAPDTPLIPLQPLRSLNAKASLSFKTITASGLDLTNNQLQLDARDGLLRLKQFHTEVADGTIDASGSLNAKGKSAVIDSRGKVANLQLASLLKSLEREEQLTGAINADFNANTRGLTGTELFQGLKAKAQLKAAQLQLAGFNLEQQLCTIAEQLDQATGSDTDTPPATTEAEASTAPAPKQWPNYTRLRDVNADISVANGIATVGRFSAGVEKLEVGSRGQLDLNQMQYHLKLPMTLTGEVSSEDQCRIGNKFLRNRELSLVRCKGSLDNPAPGQDCGLDNDAFKGLVKDYAKYKLGKKVDKEKDQLLEKAKEKLGDDTLNKLKGLFKKRK